MRLASIMGNDSQKMKLYKLGVSIAFGLLGFFINFYPLHFFIPPHKASLVLGLVFPMLISISWGWKYGLISLTLGLGGQTMWFLWVPVNGWAPFVAIPVYNLWVLWHGWSAKQKNRILTNFYWAEIPFRIFNTIILYTIFRWVWQFNPSPWAPTATLTTAPIAFVKFVAIKQLIEGLIILLAAHVLLNFQVFQKILLIKKKRQVRTGYVISTFLLFGFVFWFIAGFSDYLYSSEKIKFLLSHQSPSLAQALALQVPGYELFTRTLFILICLVAGLIVSKYVLKFKESEVEKEEAYKIINNSTSVAFLWKNMEGWPVEFVTQNVQKLFGYSAEDFIAGNISYLETIHPEDQERISDEVIFHSQNRDVHHFKHKPYRIITKSNETRWVSDNSQIRRNDQGNITHYQGIVEDITELRQKELVLKRQQQTITLNNHIANAFLTSQAENLYANVLDVIREALNSNFGYFGYLNENGDLVCPSMTRKVWDQCQIADKNIILFRTDWAGLWGRSLLEQRTLMANNGLRLPKGHVPLRNVMAVPIVHQETLIGQVVVANKPGGYDINDQELLENAILQIAPVLNALLNEARQKQENEDLEEQYRQAQKMESVGRLAGGVAHDFNNMLGVIIGNTDLALSEIDSSQPAHANLLEIGKAAERSADLTRQLLAFARKQTVAPKVLDLNDTVAGMLKMLQRLIGEDITLTWIPGGNLCSIKIDPSQIDQLLANLCVNARDAINGVGKITLETTNTSFDKAYCSNHADFIPGEYTLLTVSDSGCGIDKETQAKIFDPFFTTKDLGQGTGLGLSTVYGIIKQNNGFINVYSESGQGTTFKIYLPRYAGKAADKQEEKQTDIPGGHETILLVEDEPALLELSKNMLESIGYQVLATDTPKNALELANRHPETIHLLLTDVVMPEMNGLDLSKRLVSLYPNLKSLFMSGYTANVIARHGILNEGVNFLPKPFSIHNLADAVRKVLAE